MLRSTRDARQGPDRPAAGLEFRESEGAIAEVELLAQVFGRENDWNEIFEPGAFARSISQRIPAGRVKVADGHVYGGAEASQLIAKVTAGREEPRGLVLTCAWSKTQRAQTVGQLLRDGTVDECSIEFRPIRARREMVPTNDPAKPQREVTYVEEAMLRGIALVPYSSQAINAVVAVRHAAPWRLSAAPDLPSLAADGRADRVRAAIAGARLREAFLLEDDADEALAICIADVRDGQLVITPGSVRAAASELLARRAELGVDGFARAIADLDAAAAIAGVAGSVWPWEGLREGGNAARVEDVRMQEKAITAPATPGAPPASADTAAATGAAARSTTSDEALLRLELELLEMRTHREA